MRPQISFVIPCYNSEKTIESVVQEIIETVGDKNKYEIILVNDGSRDHVWKVISEMSSVNEHIVGINLSKNFGQHSAVLAGFHFCNGDYVVALDDDGQTPANQVYDLIFELEKGYDVVYARYPEAKKSLYRQLGSNLATKMSNYIFDIEKGQSFYTGSYFVAKKFIIDEMIKYENSFPYLGGLVLRTTRNIGYVDINHKERMEGKSGYKLGRLISLWINGFTAFSVKPLQFSTYFGFFTALIGFLYTMVIIIRKLFIPELETLIPYGWSSQTAIMLMLGGIILINMGLMGEYIGRIYVCINKSPQFVIKEIRGLRQIKVEASGRRNEDKQ
ncbi:MAG: glycosyltransferase family 2 protein [Lachnospiraceae bacterium]|nr:glycosyltransferase family 2 protein [Lachnospiraceae bacterium]